MINCERCKQKMTLHDLVIVRDKQTGVARKYCQNCAAIINTQQESRKTVPVRKEEPIQKTTPPPPPPPPPPEPESYTPPAPEPSEPSEPLIMEEPEPVLPNDINANFTDIVPREHIIQRINTYLGEDGINIAPDDYCYIKIVGNHLEIGRAKIILEE